MECQLKILQKRCNCTGLSTYAAVPSNVSVCEPAAALDCYMKLAYDFNTLINQCRTHNCTEACQYWSYRPVVTAGKVTFQALASLVAR